MSENEQPKPYHPQQRFGSGIEAADRAYPNLHAYYGDGFQASFTTLDLLDSLAARVKLIEDTLEVLQQPHEIMFQALRQINLTGETDKVSYSAVAEPVKVPWYGRLLLKLTSWAK